MQNGFTCHAPSDSACLGDGFAHQVLRARFVFSPRGNGEQNHRDWEALVGGAVPLVDYSPTIAELWRCLPVVQALDHLWIRTRHA